MISSPTCDLVADLHTAEYAIALIRCGFKLVRHLRYRVLHDVKLVRLVVADLHGRIFAAVHDLTRSVL